MTKRVTLTDRRGVNAFEDFVINILEWIFRDQPITDIGIDGYVEQLDNGNSTGKLLAIQIKTGLSNISINKDGNFDYYMSDVHYNYWLSFAVPVIIILYDPDQKILYWEHILKRNITKTKSGRHKITINKNSKCVDSTIYEFNDIINLYESKSFNDNITKPLYKEEIESHCKELFLHCAESLSIMTQHIYKLESDYNRGNQQMEKFIRNKQKENNLQVKSKKIIKEISHFFVLSLNIRRTRISNERLLMLNVFTDAFQYLEEYLLLSLNNKELKFLKYIFTCELTHINNSILSLINTLNQVIPEYNSSKSSNLELNRAEILFSRVIDDYRSELIDISELVKSIAIRLD